MSRIKKIIYFWHRRIPPYIKWGAIFSLFLIIFILAHVSSPTWESFFFRLYYLPVFMGSLLGGLKGGFFCALLAIFLSLPLANNLFPYQLISLQEIGLFLLFGITTGFLADRERAEREKLKQAEHLALLGKAAAAIAHELKTPLVVIGGFAKLLQKQFSPDDQNWKKLDIILKETKWMQDMIHGILDFSKPIQLKLKPVNFKHFIKDAIKLVEVSNNAQIELYFLTDLPEVKIDPDKFKQVLINIINNAIQAAPDKPVKVTVCTEKNKLIVKITDQGAGIPKEYQEKIFEPFFTTKTRGTGLGLAIVKRIIEAHKGNISFKSIPGKGTTFIITLPFLA
jgi:signal transduction histidine kinase